MIEKPTIVKYFLFTILDNDIQPNPLKKIDARNVKNAKNTPTMVASNKRVIKDNKKPKASILLLKQYTDLLYLKLPYM